MSRNTNLTKLDTEKKLTMHRHIPSNTYETFNVEPLK